MRIFQSLQQRASAVVAFPILKVKSSIDASLVKNNIHTLATKLLFVSGAYCAIYIN